MCLRRCRRTAASLTSLAVAVACPEERLGDFVPDRPAIAAACEWKAHVRAGSRRGGIPLARIGITTLVTDLEWNRDDVRRYAEALQVGGVDLAVVVRIGDDCRRVVVDPVLVLVGGHGNT